MSEQLLSIDGLARKLSASRRTVYRNIDKLKAKGLQQTGWGRSVRFREASADHLIKRAAERGEQLF